MSLIRRYVEHWLPILQERMHDKENLEPLIRRETPAVRTKELKFPGVRAAYKPKPKTLDYSSHS
ncbi:MAG: hypothetical protein AB7P20_15620 [Rhizobiaceae bacterium]